MLETSDLVVVGVQFSGDLNASVVMRSYTNRFDPYQSVASLSDVINSAGGKFWQDKANNIVWVKIRGGFWQFWTNNTNEAVPTDDEKLYEPTVLRIYQQ